MSLHDLASLFKNNTAHGTNASFTHGNNSFYNLRGLNSLERDTFPTVDWSLLIYFMIAVGVVVVALNTFILVLFLRFKALRTKRNIFPVNLTISDCFVGFLVIPLFILAEEMLHSGSKDSYISRHRIHHQSGLLLNFNSLVSIYSLTAVIVERTVAICLPLKYRRDFTARKAFIVILLIWTLSATFACLSFIVYKPLYDKDKISDLLELFVLISNLKSSLDRYSYYSHTFYGLCVSGTVISGLSLLVQCYAVSRTLRRRQNRASGRSHKAKSEELKAVYMLGLMFLAVLLWITSIVYLHGSDRSKARHIGMYLGRFCLSIINPILYTLLKQDVRSKVKDNAKVVRRAFLSCFQCHCCYTKQSVSQGTTGDISTHRKIDWIHMQLEK